MSYIWKLLNTPQIQLSPLEHFYLWLIAAVPIVIIFVLFFVFVIMQAKDK